MRGEGTGSGGIVVASRGRRHRQAGQLPSLLQAGQEQRHQVGEASAGKAQAVSGIRQGGRRSSKGPRRCIVARLQCNACNAVQRRPDWKGAIMQRCDAPRGGGWIVILVGNPIKVGRSREN
jgi:hypothetical protein